MEEEQEEPANENDDERINDVIVKPPTFRQPWHAYPEERLRDQVFSPLFLHRLVSAYAANPTYDAIPQLLIHMTFESEQAIKTVADSLLGWLLSADDVSPLLKLLEALLALEEEQVGEREAQGVRE